MFLDVVVCTRDRPRLIGKCLEALMASDYPEYGVTVVDQSCDSATADAVGRLADGANRLRYIRDEGAGLSRARNIGIENGSGDVIAFTDDDCEPQSNWVAAMAEEFASRPDIAGIYGRSLPCGETSWRRTVGVKTSLHEHIFQGRCNPWSLGHGNNMAFRREVFQGVGLFDEVVGPGAPLHNCDDADFTYRVLRKGLKLAYSPKPVVYHDQFRQEDDLWRLEKSYNLGAGALYSKWLRMRDPYALLIMLDRWVRGGIAHIGYGCLTARKAHLKLGWYRVAYSVVGIFSALRFPIDPPASLFVNRGSK